MSTTTLTTKPTAAPAPVATASITDLVAGIRPDLAKTMTAAQGLLKMAKAMTITNTEDLVYAQEELKGIATAAKRLEDRRKTYSVPLNDAIKTVNSTFKPVADVLGQAGDLLRELTGNYLLEQERARAAEEAARARLARIEAARIEAQRVEAERVAAAQRAEAARIEAERMAQAEADQRRAAALVEQASTQAETMLAAGDTDGAAIAAQTAADAIQAETDARAAGQVVRAQAVAAVEAIDESAALVVITTAPAATSQATGTVAGVSWAKGYEHEVVDIVALCKFVAENPSCAHYVLPNEAAIKKQVAKFGLDTGLPGVNVRERMAMKVRT